MNTYYLGIFGPTNKRVVRIDSQTWAYCGMISGGMMFAKVNPNPRANRVEFQKDGDPLTAELSLNVGCISFSGGQEKDTFLSVFRDEASAKHWIENYDK